ncbi:flagellin [Candidatus Liberibacter solanacearum]|uniref:Flagellin n=1 Tax=Candidatus Liberibacter solanacearum TaxID=556287 RepID=A0A3R7Q3W6_9HYPH|nr:flagellin [Candidatus Liberibacter solanacearum]RPD37337.1 flagellin [Candidatus Liberibacter solanacearum]
MTSILTNLPAMSASQKLRAINYNLEVVQDRVSSGLRVADSSDNAAYWSIAKMMKSDNAALSAVSDAIGLGSSKVDIAKAGMDESIKVLSSIKEKLVAATEHGTDAYSVQAEISQLQQQLGDIAQGSSFNGENWLRASLVTPSSSVSKSVVSSFIRDESGQVQVTTIDYNLDSSTLLFDTSGQGDRYGLLDKKHQISVQPQKTSEIEISYLDSNSKLQTIKKDLATASGAWLKAAGATFNQEKGVAILPNNSVVSGSSPSPASPPSTSEDKVIYIRVGNQDQWVKGTDSADYSSKLSSDSKSSSPKKAVAVTEYGNKSYYIDVSAVALDNRTVEKTIDLDYSIVTLDITKHSNDSMYNEATAMKEMLSFIDHKLKLATSAAGRIGSISSRIHLQEDFVKFMRDAIEKGIGRLVDADMADESSKLSALQTQQQLAIQALSIVNNSTSKILSLFRG